MSYYTVKPASVRAQAWIMWSGELAVARFSDPELAKGVAEALNDGLMERAVLVPKGQLAVAVDALRHHNAILSDDPDVLLFGKEGVDRHDGGRCRLCEKLTGGDSNHRCWA